MKVLIPNYAFNKAAKTVTFSDYVSITLENILLITNVSDNTIIYQFNNAAKGGSVATNVLTLTYDTSGMNNTDKLQIFYDDTNYDASGKKTDAKSAATDSTAVSMISLLKQISAMAQSPASTPVTGTFFQATQPVSATSLPLPTGASTSAKQDTGNTSLSSIDGKIPALGQALAGASVPVVLTAAQLATLTPLTTVAVTGTFWQTTQPVSVASLPLPSGAATSAKQDTGNTSVASIDTKTPALGPALAAGSVPVVLTAAQLSTLTPLSSVAVTQSTSPWVVSGTVTANIGTTNGLALDATLTGGNQVVKGGLTDNNAAPGANNVGALIALANASTPSATEGDQVLLSTDLSRRLRIQGTGATASAVPGVAMYNGFRGNTGNLQAGDVLAATSVSNDSTHQAAQLVAGAFAESASLSTASVTNNDLLPSLDVSNYAEASIQVLGTWTGTITFQGCNDNSTFQSVCAIAKNSTSGSVVTTTTANNVFKIPLGFRFLRIRVTTGGTGTVTGVLELYTTVSTSLSSVVSATQNGGWTVAANKNGTWTLDAATTATGTTISYTSALTSTKTTVKAGAGNLYGYHIVNTNTVGIYIQVFNKLIANVTVGTTAPDLVLYVPANSVLDTPPSTIPVGFSTGIAIAATTGHANSTAPTNTLDCSIYYI